MSNWHHIFDTEPLIFPQSADPEVSVSIAIELESSSEVIMGFLLDSGFLGTYG